MEISVTATDYHNDILHLLDHQLSNHIHPEHSLQLIKILGGIENILKHYLSHANVDSLLSKEQLHRIHQLLHKHSATPIRRSSDKKIRETGDIFDQDPICYELHENDTYLHALFGEHIATQIIQRLHTKPMIIIMALAGICWALLNVVSNSLIYPIYTIVTTCCLWIPFFVIYFLSGNIIASKMILCSFEFWFKLFYALFLGIMVSIHSYHYGITHGWQYPTLQAITCVCALINVCMVIANVSAFDAHHISTFKKLVFASISAALFTFNTIQYSFFLPDSDDFLVYITPNNSISVASLISSAARILAIFMWRQTVLIIIRSKKQKCVLIKHIPSITWNAKSGKSAVDTHSEIDKDVIIGIGIREHADDGGVLDNEDDASGIKCNEMCTAITLRTRQHSISASVTCNFEMNNQHTPVLESRLSTPL
eukprot:1106368_1